MFATIIKTITFALVISIFFFLANNYEVYAPHEEITKTLPKEEGLQPAIVSELATSSIKKEEDHLEQLATQSTSTSIIQAIPYEELKGYVSDTDESYRPLVSPCTKPLGFKIGTFDTRFGISKAQFIQEIEQSAKIWEEAVDKKLFYHDDNGALTINLIYDERQATTVDVNLLALDIENAKENAKKLETTSLQEKELYIKDNEQLTSDIENFTLRQKAYSAKVDNYNISGGASKNEYDAMMLELANLKTEAKTLEERRVSIVALSESLNKKIIRYNEFVAYINSLIRKSNQLGAKKFTEGRFVPGTLSVDIYQYNNTVKLRRVVMHELGHVLGINHTKSISSIMYSFNSATTTSLHKEDVAALHVLCGN